MKEQVKLLQKKVNGLEDHINEMQTQKESSAQDSLKIL